VRFYDDTRIHQAAVRGPIARLPGKACKAPRKRPGLSRAHLGSELPEII